MVESKCVEVDEKQASPAKAMEQEGLKPTHLTNEQWQALIALHRTLLHEHHDFFLASQHPSSSPPLRRLAAKYNMPSRMWRHVAGFHTLLNTCSPSYISHILLWLCYMKLYQLLKIPASFLVSRLPTIFGSSERTYDNYHIHPSFLLTFMWCILKG